MSGRVHSTPRERHVAEAAVLVVMALWAANFIVVKAAVAVLPPIGFTWIRFCLAAVTLVVLLKMREGSIGMPRRDLITIGALGALGFGLYQVLWTTGLTSVTAGDSALLIAATPVLTALLAVVARSDVLTPLKLGGALLSFVGVGVVVVSGPGIAIGGSLVGELLTLAAALCWAIFTAFAAPLVGRFSPLRTTTWSIVAGTVAMTPFALVQLATANLSAIGPEVLGAVLYSGVLAAGLSNVAIFHAIKLLGPTRITAFQFLVPAMAVVLGALFLAEAIRAGQVLGGLVIVAGILITRSGGGWVRLRRGIRPA